MNPSPLPARAISCDVTTSGAVTIFPLPGSPIRRMIPAILIRWLAAPLGREAGRRHVRDRRYWRRRVRPLKALLCLGLTPISRSEYIAEAKGCDIRCLVVGNEVVAAIERCAKAADFRPPFIVAGGQHHDDSPVPDIATVPCQTPADVAGVDVSCARAGDGSECPPGLEGIERLWRDIAGE